MSVQSVKEEDSPKSEGDSFRSSVTAVSSQSGNRLELSLKELDKLIEIAEEKIPANQRSPKNQRHRRAFQKVMERYFKNLEAAFPYKKIEKIYESYAKEE